MKQKILHGMCALLLLTLAVAYGTFCLIMYEQQVDAVKEQLRVEVSVREQGAAERTLCFVLPAIREPELQRLGLEGSVLRRRRFHHRPE